MSKQLKRFYISSQPHDRECNITKMIESSWEWVKTRSIEDADLVVFGNGPTLWRGWDNFSPNNNSMCAPMRELLDVRSFLYSLDNSIKMVGINRGALFLNTMCGGKSRPVTSGHTSPHYIKDLWSKSSFFVHSKHFNIMEPSEDGVVLAVDKDNDNEPEVVAYPHLYTLCFQPNVEDIKNDDLETGRSYFMSYLTELMELS